MGAVAGVGEAAKRLVGLVWGGCGLLGCGRSGWRETRVNI